MLTLRALPHASYSRKTKTIITPQNPNQLKAIFRVHLSSPFSYLFKAIERILPLLWAWLAFSFTETLFKEKYFVLAHGKQFY